MKLTVNGETKEFARPLTLEQLIQELGVRKETVVAEVNRKIVPMDQRTGVNLADNDQIELIQFVGGG